MCPDGILVSDVRVPNVQTESLLLAVSLLFKATANRYWPTLSRVSIQPVPAASLDRIENVLVLNLFEVHTCYYGSLKFQCP
jgi:hypothetical protein